MKVTKFMISSLCVGLLMVGSAQMAMADAPSAEDGEGKAALKSDESASKHKSKDSETSSGTHRVARLESAQNEDLAAAVGHYARARSLLIAALNEFDSGMKLANPDSLLDSKRFRTGIIDRAEDLERVLDPQPRATKGGVKYNADPRLLGRK